MSYTFSMRGEYLMIAEETDGRKSWEKCARIFKDEGKSVDSNRQRKGWAWTCLATSQGKGVYKAKGEAKAAAEEHVLAVLSGNVPTPAPSEEPEQEANDENVPVGKGFGQRDPETGLVHQSAPGQPGVVVSDPALDDFEPAQGPRFVKTEDAVEEALKDAVAFCQKHFPGDMQAMEVAGKAFLAARDLPFDE